MSHCCDNFKNNPKYQAINRWVLVGLTTLSWIFSIVTLASCTFIVLDLSRRRLDDIPSPMDIANQYGIDYTPDYGNYDSPSYSSPDYSGYGGGDDSVSLNFGVFRYDLDGKCEKDDSNDIGTGQKSSRAFGVITNMCLIVGLIFILLVIFVLPKKISNYFWTSTRILYIIAFVGNLLTFSFWSDVDCKEDDICDYVSLGGAGILTAINVFLLIGIITLSWFVPIPEKPMCGSTGGVGDTSPVVKSSEVGKPTPVEHAAAAISDQPPVTDTEIAVSVGPSALVEHISQ